MFNFEQDAGYTNNNINLSSSPCHHQQHLISIPIKNHNANYRHDLIPSPTSSGHISFSDGSDKSSDTSTDANDIYGSSVDSHTPSTFVLVV